jgi:phosphoglycolate phosphatase-like HAD superfamily hydrolase
MPPVCVRRSAAVSAVLLLAVGVSACEDSPTAPATYAHVADGRTWVAVAEPVGLPSLETWLPYLDGGSPAAERIRVLRGEAGRARSAGRVELSRALEAEAFAEAAGALSRSPDARTLVYGLAALESWVARALARLEADPDPGLARSVVEVQGRRDAARAGLAAGDTAAAVAEITRGAEEARAWSPVAVGLRMLARAEARLDAEAVPDPAARRARRLVAGAREGLATGDSVRAVRRALYALQLLEPYGAASSVGEAIDPEPQRR